MILVDYNQIAISNFAQHTNLKLNIDDGMFRHMILNTIRSLRNKFKNKYGELVICCDGSDGWRKKVFAYYKIKRKSDRQKTTMDWTTCFRGLDELRQELIDHFPYKVICVEGAEGDDVIATLAMKFSNEDNIIVSSDKDFIQLHKYGNTRQYSPILKKMVNHNNPDKYLIEHILKGDRGDGIPNVNSKDDAFIGNNRQNRTTQKFIDLYLDKNIDDIDFENETLKRNWKRNRQLIDFTQIPKEISDNILDSFVNYQINNRGNLLQYFIDKRLRNLIDIVSEF